MIADYTRVRASILLALTFKVQKDKSIPMEMYNYMHTYIEHTYIRKRIHQNTHIVYIQTYIQTHIGLYPNTYTCTYLITRIKHYACINTYGYTYAHTNMIYINIHNSS